MKVLQVSTGKQIKIANAVTFMSRERSATEVAHMNFFVMLAFYFFAIQLF